MFNKDKQSNPKASRSDRHRGSSLPPSLLAEGLTIEGDLVSTGDIQVDGTVKGDLSCNCLTLGPDGVIIGEIKANTVHVRGRVEGRIVADTVELAATAVIAGDILHDSIGVEAGARIEGNLKRKPTAAAAEPAKPAEGAKPSLIVTNP